MARCTQQLLPITKTLKLQIYETRNLHDRLRKQNMLQDKHRFTKRYIKLQTNNNT